MGFRGLTGLCALALALCVLTSCGGGKPGASSGALKIEFWHYFGQDHVKALRELIDRFQKENPGIEVVPVFQGNPQMLSQKLSGSFAASPPNNPAVATVYENWTSDYVAKGLMDPVQDHFAGPDGLTKEEQDDIVSVYREGNSWDGKMVTMPFNKSIYMLYMNMDKLGKAGFTTAPRTRDELKDAIIKTTEKDAQRVKTYGIGTAPLSEAFTTHFFAAGGQFFDEKGTIAFDGAEGLAVLQFLKDLQYPEKHIYVTTDYLSTPLGNEQIAMYIYSSASFPYMEKSVAGKFKWAVAPVPPPAGKQARYLMQGTNIGIFKNRPDAERQAAWKFVKFLTSVPSAVYWATRTGYMPIRYSMLKDKEMQDYLAKNPNYGVACSLVLDGKGAMEPKMAVWEGMRDEFSVLVDRVLNKGADPAAELKSLRTKVEEKMKAGAGKK